MRADRISVYKVLFIFCVFPSLASSDEQAGHSADHRIDESEPLQDNYSLNPCSTDDDCLANCGNIPNLTPLCDRNGTCVCDCSDMDVVNANPVPPNCAAWIPSMEHDQCSTSCSQNYLRPSKICGEIPNYLYCTCLCKWY